jgi:hypothetical protein
MEKSTKTKMENIEDLMAQYLETLSEKEKKAYHIAKSHLGSSFQLEKSNTFLQWKREHCNNNSNT